MTYATLQTGIADYIHRNDLTEKIPGFISLAENFMFRELNLRELETSIAGETSGALIALPLDFHSLVRVTVVYAGREVTLDKFTNSNSSVVSACLPSSYDFEGNAIRLYPSPSSGYSYKIYYQANLVPLSASVPTNWLETNAADLYLYTSVLEAARWCENDQVISRVVPMIAPMLDSVRKLSERKGMPLRGTMQIKVRR